MANRGRRRPALRSAPTEYLWDHLRKAQAELIGVQSRIKGYENEIERREQEEADRRRGLTDDSPVTSPARVHDEMARIKTEAGL